MPQAVNDPHSQSHHRTLFLANHIIQESFNEFHWKRIEKERNEPLEDPCFVGDLRLFDFCCCFGHPFIEQAPEEPTIDFGQRKSILVYPNEKKILVEHETGENLEGLVVTEAHNQQIAGNEVKSLSVAHFREEQCEFLKQNFESNDVVSLPEELLFGERPADVLPDLVEARMLHHFVLFPKHALGDALHPQVGQPELPLPHVEQTRSLHFVARRFAAAEVRYRDDVAVLIPHNNLYEYRFSQNRVQTQYTSQFRIETLTEEINFYGGFLQWKNTVIIQQTWRTVNECGGMQKGSQRLLVIEK